MNDISTKIHELLTAYGPDAVIAAVKQLTAKSIPATYSPLVSEAKLAETLYQLDTAIAEILEAGKQQEDTYQNKAELLKRQRALDTEVQLCEANALMQIQGQGKDAFVTVNGFRVAMTNDASRDAYRRNASKDLRTDQALVESQIASIDVALSKARDAYASKQEALNGIRVKANLQAALLAYLK